MLQIFLSFLNLLQSTAACMPRKCIHFHAFILLTFCRALFRYRPLYSVSCRPRRTSEALLLSVTKSSSSHARSSMHHNGSSAARRLFSPASHSWASCRVPAYKSNKDSSGSSSTVCRGVPRLDTIVCSSALPSIAWLAESK